MDQSPFWEANQFQASQEISRILWSPKVHYRIHKCPARHLSLYWAKSMRSIPPHPTPWRSSLILSSHLRLGLPSGLFLSGFPTKILYTPLLSPIRATCPAHLILLDFITRIVLGEEYRSLSSSLCSFLHYLVPLRSKYSPQHLILQQPQPTFLPQCERPRFTPIPNRQKLIQPICNIHSTWLFITTILGIWNIAK